MASDDEGRNERFDMDNDYEGGQWINGEFYATGKRKKRQQTRDDQLYGVFNDSEDDEGGRGRRGRRNGGIDGGSNDADFSRPVGFVSTGIASAPPLQEEGGRARPTGLGSASAGASATAAAHLGFGGLGFSSARTAGTSGRGEPDDEEEVLPTALGRRVKQRAAERLRDEDRVHKQEAKREANIASDPGIASFERHTKGIGMKLLEKMGYKKGEGLGRDKSGIAKPIEATLRPKGQALGFGKAAPSTLGFSRVPPIDFNAKADAVSGKDTKLTAAAPGKLWKKRNQDVRQRREYRTAAEVLEEAEALPLAARVSATTIIDMRGPQTRVVTNMEHLNVQAETTEGDRTPMPELQHNLRLLVDLAESAIKGLDSKLQHEQDTATVLGKERSRLEDEAEGQAEQLARLAAVVDEVARCQASDHDTTLEELEQAYSTIRAKFCEEYVLYNLAAAAMAQALPRLRALMQGWQPLLEPRRGLAEMLRWRQLLESESQRDAVLSGSLYDGLLPGGQGASEGSEPYTQLVFELIIAPLQSAITSSWEPRDPEPLLAFLEAWERALPPAGLRRVLDSLVLPKLRAAAAAWEPRHEAIPVHQWLFPWLPHLRGQLEELWPGIRHKFALALAAWSPADGSALAVLGPWAGVYEAADWEQLLSRSIVPKLAAALLGQLSLTPSGPALEPLQWLASWQDVMPPSQMVALLDAGVFPQLHATLRFWLSGAPNFDEVTQWFLATRALLPQKALDQERVRSQLAYATNCINAAQAGLQLPSYDLAPLAATSASAGYGGAYTGGSGSASAAAAAAASAAAAAAVAAATAASAAASVRRNSAAAAAELSLRDLVAQFAAENGLEFVPKPGRYVEGLQVYGFGTVSVMLDNVQQTIKAQIRDRWAPVSLDTVLQEHLARQAKRRG